MTTIHQLSQLTLDFVNDPSTGPEDRTLLQRALLARPAFQPVTDALPADEAIRRLDLARRIELQHQATIPNATPPPCLNAFQLAVLCIIPMAALEETAARVTRGNLALEEYFSSVETFVRIFLLTSHPDAPPVNLGHGQCRNRDGNRCIFLGTADPDACHVFPFAATSSNARAIRLRRLWNIVHAVIGDRAIVVSSGRPGGRDKAWNMLCLNPQLHRWWGQARFGLKCLGVQPDAAGTAIVSIQFVWMAKQTGAADAWSQELRIDAGDGDAWVAQQRSRPPYGTPGDGHDNEHDRYNHNGIVAAVHAQIGRPLRSGSMAFVVLPSLSDALDMKAVLDVQWACISLASMSGAAGSDDFLDADEFDDTCRWSVLTRDAQRE
ncbi:hypothetical protein Sste5346_006228 [Sporothrix stenoceras]|uniref:HNH nuclease domain-containing protein n=1 Tax=Sporothrix stenoceras TaxID=5173 RepID=A0ABR3Z0K7_9PEZI